MPDLKVRQIGAELFSTYAGVSIAFRVESVFRAEPPDGGLGGIKLTEEPIPP